MLFTNLKIHEIRQHGYYYVTCMGASRTWKAIIFFQLNLITKKKISEFSNLAVEETQNALLTLPLYFMYVATHKNKQSIIRKKHKFGRFSYVFFMRSILRWQCNWSKTKFLFERLNKFHSNLCSRTEVSDKWDVRQLRFHCISHDKILRLQWMYAYTKTVFPYS